MNGDGRAEYAEQRDARGCVVRLGFDPNEDGVCERWVAWRPSGSGAGTDRSSIDVAGAAIAPQPDDPHLLIILDSVPFALVNECWADGRLRWFDRPTRIISPYPVMTDPCLADFFGLIPCPAVESDFFDGHRRSSAVRAYLGGDAAPWLRKVDYSLDTIAHLSAYDHPYRWLDHELRRIMQHFDASDRARFLAYVVSTSGIGHTFGRDGHLAALRRVERACRRLIYERRGHMQLTLMSDHGHNLVPSRWQSIATELGRLGYRVGDRLERPGDCVVPAWGVVSYAGIYTREPQRVARDALRLESVELASYVDESGAVCVLARDGEASIEHEARRFRYVTIAGDPLRLGAPPRDSPGDGSLADRWLTADEWLARTSTDEFPDPVVRLWRAHHELFRHTPDVLLSLKDGFAAGSATIARRIPPASVHGNLRLAGSSGFVLTTTRALPEVVRMSGLRSELRLEPRGSGSEATTGSVRRR